MYDPSPLEWAGLLGFIASAFISIYAFLGSAISIRWWDYTQNGTFPSTIKSVAFGFCYFIGIVSVAIGTWLAWAEGVRGYDPLLAPRGGDYPSNARLRLIMILYAIFIGLNFMFGPILFVFGIRRLWKFMSVMLCFSMAGVGLALTIINFLIWWVAGFVSSIGYGMLVIQLCSLFRFWKIPTTLKASGNGYMKPAYHLHNNDTNVFSSGVYQPSSYVYGNNSLHYR